MRLTEIAFGSQPPVEGYGPGFFRIGGKIIEGDIFLGPEGAGSWAGDFAALDRGAFDLLLIGTGKDIAPLPEPARTHLTSQNIPFEVMATAPAARTYNVLLSEGRRVAVILTAV